LINHLGNGYPQAAGSPEPRSSITANIRAMKKLGTALERAQQAEGKNIKHQVRKRFYDIPFVKNMIAARPLSYSLGKLYKILTPFDPQEK
jgi:hypothetical protein